MDLNIINKIFPPTPLLEHLKYDNEGLWSISLPEEADKISKLIIKIIGSNKKLLDGTAGLGGNTISFSKYFKNVVATEINSDRFELLKINIHTYNLLNIIILNINCIDILDDEYDGYFFDPPWGGPNYKYNNKIRFNLADYSLEELIHKIRTFNNKPIFFKLPNNYDLGEFSIFNYQINKIKNYQIITIL